MTATFHIASFISWVIWECAWSHRLRVLSAPTGVVWAPRFDEVERVLFPICIPRKDAAAYRLSLSCESARGNYAVALYNDPGATLGDLREAVSTLEETTPIARRVFGGAYLLVVELEDQLQEARAALRARETLGSV